MRLHCAGSSDGATTKGSETQSNYVKGPAYLTQSRFSELQSKSLLGQA